MPPPIRRHTAITFVALVAVLGTGAACGSTVDVASSDVPASTEPVSTDPVSTDPVSTDPAPAVVPAELVGHVWVIDGVSTIAGLQPVPPDSSATLTFSDDGRLTIDTGCNTGSAAVTSVRADGSLTVGPVALTKMACTDDALANLESTILTVLSSPVGWSIDCDALSVWPMQITDLGLSLHDAATTTETELDTDLAGILAAVAAQRVGTDNSFGGQSAFAKVFIDERVGGVDANGFVIFDSDAGAMNLPLRL